MSWNCEICNKSFGAKQTYQRHLLSSKHIKTSNTRTGCDTKRENPSVLNDRLLKSIEGLKEQHKKAREKWNKDLFDLQSENQHYRDILVREGLLKIY
jgi:hypothetical protein